MNDKERPVKYYELEAIDVKLGNIEKLILNQGAKFMTKTDVQSLLKDRDARILSLEKSMSVYNKVIWTISSTIIVGIVVGLSNLLKGGV